VIVSRFVILTVFMKFYCEVLWPRLHSYASKYIEYCIWNTDIILRPLCNARQNLTHAQLYMHVKRPVFTNCQNVCCQKETPKKSSKGEKVKDENLPAKKSEFDHEEYYIKRHYSSITAALDLFKDDELCSVPGLIIGLLELW